MKTSTVIEPLRFGSKWQLHKAAIKSQVNSQREEIMSGFPASKRSIKVKEINLSKHYIDLTVKTQT